MKNQNAQKNTAALFGAPTSEKAAGITFTLAAFLPSVFAVIFLVFIQSLGLTDKAGYEKSDWYLYANYLLVPIAFACIALLIWKWQKKPLSQTLKVQKCRYKYYIAALCLQIGLFSLSQLNTWFLEFLAKFGYQPSDILLPSMDGVGFIFVILVVAVLPAVFEELIFRGILLNGLHGFGKAGAVLVCGALFALYHQNPAQTLYQFCCGAAFALVAIKAGSILPTVLSHFLNNALILILYKWQIVSLPKPISAILICLSAACLLGSLGYLIFMDKEEKPLAPASKTARKHFLLFALGGIVICAVTWIASLFL